MEVSIDIPEGIDVQTTNNKVIISGPKGKSERDYSHIKDLIIEKNDKIVINSSKKGRKAKRDVNTVKAHINNQFKGVLEGYVVKMQEAHTHFPIKVEVKGRDIFIQNVIGERAPRKTHVVGDVKVEVKGSNITVSGVDKEQVTQTAANIRQAARIVGLDVRIYQDGIYVVEE